MIVVKIIKILLRSALYVSLSALTVAALTAVTFYGHKSIHTLADAYEVDYITSRSHPVALDGEERIGASSSQVWYKGKRYTLTNKHVCDQAAVNNSDYMNIGGKRKKILKISKKHDLCVLEPLKDAPAFRIADNYSYQQKILMIGHPLGAKQTIRSGRITHQGSGFFYWIDPFLKVNYVEVTVIGYPGNSGSPIVNEYYKLVGICFSGDSSIHTRLAAVPLKDIKIFLEEVVNEDR